MIVALSMPAAEYYDIIIMTCSSFPAVQAVALVRPTIPDEHD